MATISETIKKLLDRPVNDQKVKQDFENMGMEDPTLQDYIVTMILTRTANKGNANDLYALASLLGEKKL